MNIKIKIPAKLIGIFALVVLILAATWFYGSRPGPNPLPANIQNQLDFKSVYPTDNIDQSSIRYETSLKTLFFNVNHLGKTINISEQTAPGSVVNGTKDYISALGIKPSAQFISKVGQVAITTVFVEEHPKINNGVGPQPVKSDPIGQAAISIAGSTLVIARPANGQSLTTDQWKDFFNRLRQAH